MITLITGGQGAGKTTQALQLASGYATKLYIATAEPIDSEMTQKIANHRSERDSSYTTLEVPLDLGPALMIKHPQDIIIIDCLTVWVSNLIYYSANIHQAANTLCDSLRHADKDIILVTNECNMGLIGASPESRRYQRDLAGLNKRIAALADRLCLMVCGVEMWIKG